MGGAGGVTGTSDNADVEAFIQSNPIDQRAADALREESPEVQQIVLSRGSIAETRNPSSALMCRIRDGRNKVSGGGGAFNGDVEAFLQATSVDERAADALRSESPAVQQAMLSRGDLSGTWNASSALMCRIR